MKRLFIPLSLVLLTLPIYSQDFVHPVFKQLWRDLENKQIVTGLQQEDYEGTPFLFETNTATLVLNNGQNVDELTIRYNVFEDQMEIKNGENYYVIPKEKVFSTFVLDGHQFHYKLFVYAGKKNIGYFESLVNDEKCSVFLQHNIFLQQPEESKGYKEAQPAKFVNNPVKIFISFNNSPLQQAKSKKDFLELAPNHQKELAAYIKKNKIKFRKPESVEQLVRYYIEL